MVPSFNEPGIMRQLFNSFYMREANEGFRKLQAQLEGSGNLSPAARQAARVSQAGA